MDSLYHQTQRLILDVQDLLPKIECNVGRDTAGMEQMGQSKLEEIASNIQRLDILVNKELPVRRREARLKVDQLKQDRMMLQNALQMLQHKRMKREQEVAAREELLRQTFPSKSTETTVFIDHSLQHHSALNGIHRSIDDIWESGTAILDGLKSQKGVMKRAHRRLLDVTNMMSLSNSVMRLIERRTKQDKYLFYALAALTGLIILGSFWYFQH